MNKDDICVSVVIPTYNHRNFIAQAIDGALMQETTFPYEIIIGEDESEDGTREICIEYAERHPDKIRLFLRSRDDVIYINGQATGRFNFVQSLKAARGKYIAMCEGDDYWTDPFKLQKQVDYLESHPECVTCFHSAKIFHEDKTIRPYYYPPTSRKNMLGINDLLGRGNIIPTASVVIRNGILAEYPDWLLTIPHGDWGLHVLYAHYGTVGYLDEAMSAYRAHAGGVFSGQSPVDNCYNLIFTLETISHNISRKYKRAIKAGFSKLYLRLSTAYANQGDIPSAKKYLIRSINTYPLNPYIETLALMALLIRLYVPRVYEMFISK